MKKTMKNYRVMCYVTTQYYTYVDVLGTDEEDVKDKVYDYVNEHNFKVEDSGYFCCPDVYFKDTDGTSVFDSDNYCGGERPYNFEIVDIEEGNEVELEFDKDLDDEELIED